MVIGPYDPETGEVISYEVLVGSHGGLGGRQQEPFLLHPVDLSIGDEPLVGAPAVNAVLRRWLAALQAGRPEMSSVARPDERSHPSVGQPGPLPDDAVAASVASDPTAS
jgi:hypothetical protein